MHPAGALAIAFARPRPTSLRFLRRRGASRSPVSDPSCWIRRSGREAADAARPHAGDGSATARELAAGWDHRLRALMNGFDDFRAVDPAEVSGRDREVGMLDMRVIWQGR
jgi:hypothetical protein